MFREKEVYIQCGGADATRWTALIWSILVGKC
jgi:hypothetical protein